MSLLSNISGGLRSSTQIVGANDYRGMTGSNWYFGMGGSPDIDLYVGNTNTVWYWQAYQFCPTVASICNRKAEAYINGETKILNTTGKAKGKESDNEAAKKIRALMSKPNPLQSWSQFEAQYYLYYQIYGFCAIIPIKPSGFENIDTQYLWIIPPSLIEIKEREKIWFNGEIPIQSIKLKYVNEETNLNWDDLIILKDFTPACGFSVMPDSRLRALKTPIETVIKGYRAMNSGFDNTPLGIIGNQTQDASGVVPLTNTEKESLQRSLDGYGLGAGQKKFIISNANVNWQPINYPLESLKIPEHTKMANAAIADGLGYPYELLSSETGTTFANKREALKALYQDFIIPVAKSIYEQWNQWFNTEKYSVTIENVFTHLAILQEDDVKKSTSRLILNQALKIEYEQGLLTMNGWLEKLGEDSIGDAGNGRATDIKESDAPLASIIGVGGIQSLLSVLTAAGISDEARSASLQIIFGISAENAAAMSQGNTTETPAQTEKNGEETN
jgi:hypothetical protein